MRKQAIAHVDNVRQDLMAVGYVRDTYELSPEEVSAVKRHARSVCEHGDDQIVMAYAHRVSGERFVLIICHACGAVGEIQQPNKFDKSSDAVVSWPYVDDMGCWRLG